MSLHLGTAVVFFFLFSFFPKEMSLMKFVNCMFVERESMCISPKYFIMYSNNNEIPLLSSEDPYGKDNWKTRLWFLITPLACPTL